MSCEHRHAVSTLEKSDYGPVVVTVCPDCDKRQTAHPVELVKQQIQAPRFAGEKIVIKCPYCGMDNIEGQNFCCDDLVSTLKMLFGDTVLDA